MKTSTSETSMVALPSGFTNRTNEPNTSTPAEPKFSHEFVAEQLILIINSPDCTNELKKAAATMLVENEAKHRQVRSINESVSSDNMPSSSLCSFSVSRTPSPSPPPTPTNEKDPPPKPRRLRDRDLYHKKKKREKKPRRPRKPTDNFDFESSDFYNSTDIIPTSIPSTDADNSTKYTSHESPNKSTGTLTKSSSADISSPNSSPASSIIVQPNAKVAVNFPNDKSPSIKSNSTDIGQPTKFLDHSSPFSPVKAAPSHDHNPSSPNDDPPNVPSPPMQRMMSKFQQQILHDDDDSSSQYRKYNDAPGKASASMIDDEPSIDSRSYSDDSSTDSQSSKAAFHIHRPTEVFIPDEEVVAKNEYKSSGERPPSKVAEPNSGSRRVNITTSSTNPTSNSNFSNSPPPRDLSVLRSPNRQLNRQRDNKFFNFQSNKSRRRRNTSRARKDTPNSSMPTPSIPAPSSIPTPYRPSWKRDIQGNQGLNANASAWVPLPSKSVASPVSLPSTHNRHDPTHRQPKLTPLLVDDGKPGSIARIVYVSDELLNSLGIQTESDDDDQTAYIYMTVSDQINDEGNDSGDGGDDDRHSVSSILCGDSHFGSSIDEVGDFIDFEDVFARYGLPMPMHPFGI